MADSNVCSCEAIQKFLMDNGGKVSNQELVKHFKKFLSVSDGSQDTKRLFKDYVNTVAIIKVEDGVKYVILRKRGHNEQTKSRSPCPNRGHDIENDLKKVKLSDQRDESDNIRPQILHSHSSPAVFTPSSDNGTIPTISSPVKSSDLSPAPQPPPRCKHSTKGKENRGAKYEENLRHMQEDREAVSSCSDEIREVVSPGSVKEKAHRLNTMASETDLALHSKQSSTRMRRDKTGDDDAASISSLDPKRKMWILSAVRSDYHELIRLLRLEPKLAGVRDHNKYTALHWASKNGNLDVVKLMAGTHKLDSNSRTTGGYTPLHLAAICGREEIMEVLINTYGADPNTRDYSGKRPHQYMSKRQAERFLTLFPELNLSALFYGKVVGGQRENGLMRMGSLNSKVKKASVLSASGRAINRMKSWGSADNIPQRDFNLMPPPKTLPKKKKSRKQHSDIIGLSENWRGRTPDSDSDSASGFAS